MPPHLSDTLHGLSDSNRKLTYMFLRRRRWFCSASLKTHRAMAHVAAHCIFPCQSKDRGFLAHRFSFGRAFRAALLFVWAIDRTRPWAG